MSFFFLWIKWRKNLIKYVYSLSPFYLILGMNSVFASKEFSKHQCI
uniref:Uncharacterized protein n=1 Tax=Rhizophora mucronata TaxID=61149 RepID=A0A2P2PXV9_RHIMU